MEGRRREEDRMTGKEKVYALQRAVMRAVRWSTRCKQS